MTRPTPLPPDLIHYTREAARARITGVMKVRCVITTEGTTRDCRVIQSVPLMDEAVVNALQRHRGAPVTKDGHPVNVYYMYTVRLRMPESTPPPAAVDAPGTLTRDAAGVREPSL